MKFQLWMDRRAKNNVPSTEMPFWVDTQSENMMRVRTLRKLEIKMRAGNKDWVSIHTKPGFHGQKAFSHGFIHMSLSFHGCNPVFLDQSWNTSNFATSNLLKRP